MESNPENSMISSAEYSVSLPSMKRQKTVSDRDGDRSDDTLHQEEESKIHLSLEQTKAIKSYKPPTGRRLRSLNEVSKYLKDHAESVAQGVELSQFSFEIPSPLQEDYVIKRSQKSQSDASQIETPKLLQPEEVQPIDREAAGAQGDPRHNNEDQTEVAQSSDELQEEPTMKADSPPPAPAV